MHRTTYRVVGVRADRTRQHLVGGLRSESEAENIRRCMIDSKGFGVYKTLLVEPEKSIRLGEIFSPG